LITAATWQVIVEIDRDIVEICRMIDERGQDAPGLQRLGEMLDALMAQARAVSRPPAAAVSLLSGDTNTAG